MFRLGVWRERAEKCIGPLIYGVAAVGTAVFGLKLGQMILSPRWTEPVTAVGLVLHILLILASPVLGFLTWIATSPFGRFAYQVINLGGGVPDLTLDRLVAALLVTLLVAQLATRQRRGVRIGPVEIFAVLYIAAMALSVSSSLMGRTKAIQNWFDYYAIPFVVYLVAKNLITNRQDLRAAMHVLLIIGLYMALLATREQITGDVWFYPPDRSVIYTADVRRVVALLGNPAYLALVINMAVPFVVYLFATTPSATAKLFYLGSLAILALGTFMCYNRAGWVELPLALLVMALFSPRFRKYLLPALIVLGLVLALGGTVFLADSRIAQRLFAQGPIVYRQRALGVALTMLREHLWFGVGFNNYPFYYSRYAFWDPYLRNLPQPHNSYLTVALNAGLPAGICYVLMFAFFLWETWRLYRRAGERTFPDRTLIAALWGAVIAYLASSVVQDSIMGIYPTMILGFIMGMTTGAWQNRVIPPLESVKELRKREAGATGRAEGNDHPSPLPAP